MPGQPQGPAGGSSLSQGMGSQQGPPHPHPGLPPRGPMPGTPGPAHTPMHAGMHPQQQQLHQRPDGPMAFSEAERVVVGNRVTVPNVENHPAMHGTMGPTGYGATTPAAAMAAAAAAAAGTANMAAAAAARQQQYPYAQQYPGYDYSLYSAEWQHQLQLQREAYAAALTGRNPGDKSKVNTVDPP